MPRGAFASPISGICDPLPQDRRRWFLSVVRSLHPAYPIYGDSTGAGAGGEEVIYRRGKYRAIQRCRSTARSNV